MKNKIYVICMMVALALVSCKNDPKATETTPAKEGEAKEKTIKLANYSDENWKEGVAIEFNMFLADNTPENTELLKGVKELELVDGTIVKVTGTTVAEPFIQINLEAKGSTYQSQAAYPNLIFIK